MNLKPYWCIWLILALTLGITYQYIRPKTITLPLPTNPQTARIIRADTHIDFNYQHGQWQHNGKNADKFAKWLAQLKTACPSHYLSERIASSPDDAPITLQFNGADDWTFTAHNAYNHSHYLRHGNTVWLCAETLKPRLTQPPSYWTE